MEPQARPAASVEDQEPAASEAAGERMTMALEDYQALSEVEKGNGAFDSDPGRQWWTGLEKEESDEFSVTEMQPCSLDLTIPAELPDRDIIQEVTVGDYSTAGDQTQGRAAFEFKMTTVGEHEGCNPDDTAHNCLKCPSCGFNGFKGFSLLQRHWCISDV